MENLIQKITRGARKGIAPLLLSAMVGFGGCTNSKYVPLCDGGNLQYQNLEVLAQASEGQKLMKIDGKYYVGDDENCLVSYYDSGKDVSYASDNKGKILTVGNKDGSLFKMAWSNDGSFRKEVILR